MAGADGPGEARAVRLGRGPAGPGGRPPELPPEPLPPLPARLALPVQVPLQLNTPRSCILAAKRDRPAQYLFLGAKWRLSQQETWAHFKSHNSLRELYVWVLYKPKIELSCCWALPYYREHHVFGPVCLYHQSIWVLKAANAIHFGSSRVFIVMYPLKAIDLPFLTCLYPR